MMDTILKYEKMTLNGHPALRTVVYDGWLLGASNGYTKRANSVNMVRRSTLPLGEKVDFCEDFYRGEGLPVVFKMTISSPAGMDNMLGIRGYQNIDPTMVMTADLGGELPSSGEVQITDGISEQWIEGYLGLCGEKNTDPARAIFSSISKPAICADINDGGRTVACGMGVMEQNCVGLYSIFVDEEYRCKGLGMEVCSALMNAAKIQGADTAYLGVVMSNAPAKALYRKLGFDDCYHYWYRVKDYPCAV